MMFWKTEPGADRPRSAGLYSSLPRRRAVTERISMDKVPQEELHLYMNTVMEALKKNSTMSETAFELWFSQLHLASLDSEKAVFAVVEEIKRSFIAANCMELLETSVKDALGIALKCEIICDAPPRERSYCSPFDRAAMGIEADSELSDENGEPEEDREVMTYGLNPDYTFENFIVGSSNQFAHACSVAVANGPGASYNYNPLFIYGPSGLGKTHLMYAIANKVHETHPEMTIICAKSEDFMNELIESLSRKTMSRFREKYRKVDMLLIDDVQFISGKTSTQMEFFHTFNTLYEAKKQIVLTSDRPPKEMYTLEERIRTRFVQGMLADVQPPEFELRLAILRKKAEKNNLDIPNNVLTFLAERLNSNIREIEGAMKKISAVSFLNGIPITLEMVKTTIPEYFRENKPVTDTVDTILSVTARKYDVTVEDILGKGRTKNIKTARNVSMYVISKVLGLSLNDIGKMLDRDHSTVHSNIKAVENEIRINDKLNNDIIEIVTEVKS